MIIIADAASALCFPCLSMGSDPMLPLKAEGNTMQRQDQCRKFSGERWTS